MAALPREFKRKPMCQKIYAVGLEMLCPGGAYDWAPEIPSAVELAGFIPSKYELVHTSLLFSVAPGGTCTPAEAISIFEHRKQQRASDGGPTNS